MSAPAFKKTCIGLLTLAASSLCLGAPASATTPNKSKTVVLNEVMISSPSLETTNTAELTRYGSKAEIVTREQVERAGPSADVSRVLQMYVPGLYVATKNGPFDYGNYSLLGGRGSKDTLIMVDGVRLTDRLFGGIYIDTLPAAMIERIEVLKGGQSLFFGTNAVSGVINIVTRRAYGQHWAGNVGVGIDTFGGRNAEARIGRIFENGLGSAEWLLFASYNKSEGYKPFKRHEMTPVSKPPATDRRRSYDVKTAGMKFGQNFGANARVELYYQYADAVLDWLRPSENKETHNDRIHQIMTATFEHDLMENFRYFVKAHLNKWDTDYYRYYNTAGGGVLVKNNGDYWGFQDWGVQAQANWFFSGGHELVAGVDKQWYKAKDDVMEFHAPKASSRAFYTQFRPHFSSLPQFRPALGVRHEKLGGGGSATVWNTSAQYDFNRNWSLRAQAGTSFRLPTAYELFSNDDSPQGNPGLNPEKGKNFEIGLDFFNRSPNLPLQVSATVFSRRVENLISSINKRYENSNGEIKAKGFDVSSRLQFTENWAFSANYTRNITEDHRGSRFTHVPSHHAKLQMNFDSSNKRYGAELAARHIGKIHQNNKISYGRFTVVDTNAYYHLDSAKHHRISLNVENLLDREYAGYGYISNGDRDVKQRARSRNAELRYNWTF